MVVGYLDIKKTSTTNHGLVGSKCQSQISLKTSLPKTLETTRKPCISSLKRSYLRREYEEEPQRVNYDTSRGNALKFARLGALEFPGSSVLISAGLWCPKIPLVTDS